MTRDKQKELFDAFTKKQWAIMDSKAEDYANDDRLSNFKKVGSMCGTSPEQAILHLIATKVARLSELFAGKTPNNESTADSILDLANYSILLHMAQEERVGPRVTKEMIGPDVADLFCKQVDINKNRYVEPVRKGWPKPDSKDESFSAFLRRITGDNSLGGIAPPTNIKKSLTEQLEERWGKDVEKERNEAPLIALPKKKKVKTYKAADGVRTFRAKNMKDALKQLEAMGIKVPNGMMLGCMQVK